MNGVEANRSGFSLEGQVAQALRDNGLSFCPQFHTGWMSVLGKSIRSDFYLPASCLEEFPNGLHIEVRWQESSGTADEKVCYLYENIMTIYQRPAVVVLDGAMVASQYEYLKARADGQKLVAVCRLNEFLVFAAKLRTGTAKRAAIQQYDAAQRRLFIA